MLGNAKTPTNNNAVTDETTVLDLIKIFLQADHSWLPITLLITGLIFIVVLLLFAFSHRVRTTIKSISLPGGGSLTTNEPSETIEVFEPQTIDKTSPTVAPEPSVKDEDEGDQLYPDDNRDELNPNNWRRKMLHAAFEADPLAMEEIYKRIIDLGDEISPRENVETAYHNLRLNILNDNNSLQALEDLEAENESWTKPSEKLAEYYIQLQAFKSARAHVDVGIGRANESSEKLRFLRLLASINKDTGFPGRTLKPLYEIAEADHSPQEQAEAYMMISDIYETLEDAERSLRAKEQALSLTPENSDLRFSLAYSYSESSLPNLLSLFHYDISNMQGDKSGLTDNNLGAFYNELKVNGAAIDHWERASKSGNQRAIGNLAHKLIDAGLYDRAQELLLTADETESPDQRVVSAWSAWTQAKKAEAKKIDRLLSDSKIVHKFIEDHISAIKDDEVRKTKAETLRGSWIDGNSYEYTFETTNQNISGKLQTKERRYEISGRLIDGCAHLQFTLKERLSIGLLGLVARPEPPPSRPEWIKVQSDPETYVAYLQYDRTGALTGITVRNSVDVESLVLRRE